MSEPLTFVGAGTDGLLFTDGERLFFVWKASFSAPGVVWTGMEVKDPSIAFPAISANWCGAEVDMRNDDSDLMTPESMDLGDRMADALNRSMV